jgi:putative exosortase-associated protein (TIGR04073 family)
MNKYMRKTIPLLALLILVGALASGCANQGKKLARGMSNTFEVVRLGEFRRSMEQHGIFEHSYSAGFFEGIGRTVGRTGIGVYEVVTFPLPNPGRGYDPVCTDYLSPKPVSPDAYKPNLIEDAMYATDTNIGFSGGDVAPFWPGSRFRIFDTH